jgi:hypothetical protein
VVALELDGPDGTVRAVDLPERIRQATALARIDYSDSFLVEGFDIDERVSPETWMRAILELTPASMRRQLAIGWRFLGLRLGPSASPDHVLGWPIRDADNQTIFLAARSWVGLPAELVLARHGAGMVFATLQSHNNSAVRLGWRAVEPTHLRVVRQLLLAAARRLENLDAVAATRR